MGREQQSRTHKGSSVLAPPAIAVTGLPDGICHLLRCLPSQRSRGGRPQCSPVKANVLVAQASRQIDRQELTVRVAPSIAAFAGLVPCGPIVLHLCLPHWLASPTNPSPSTHSPHTNHCPFWRPLPSKHLALHPSVSCPPSLLPPNQPSKPLFCSLGIPPSPPLPLAILPCSLFTASLLLSLSLLRVV